MKLNRAFWLSLKGGVIILTIYLVWIVTIIIILTSSNITGAIKLGFLLVACLLFAPPIVLFFVHKNRLEEAEADVQARNGANLPALAAVYPEGGGEKKKGEGEIKIPIEPLTTVQL